MKKPRIEFGPRRVHQPVDTIVKHYCRLSYKPEWGSTFKLSVYEEKLGGRMCHVSTATKNYKDEFTVKWSHEINA